VRKKLFAPVFLLLGFFCTIGGWAWTQSSEMLNLPPSAVVEQNFTANLSNLAVAQDYLVDWSDGTSDTFNTGRLTTQSLSHNYSSAGTFLVLLKRVTAVAGPLLVAQAGITVGWSPCNIAVAPSDTVLGGTTGIVVSGLLPFRAWSFDWGDGTVIPFTSSTTGGFSTNHVFATSGVFQLKVTTVPLSAGMTGTMICLSTAQVSLPVPTMAVTPASQNLGQAVKATLGNLVSSLTYTLDWGDGSSEPITGLTSTMVNHTFATAGNFSVKLTATGIAPVIQVVNIVNSVAVMDVTPNPVFVGDTATANISNLNSAVSYSLSWGDGSSETIGGTASITSQHVYAASGTYSVQLTASGFAPVIQSLTVTVPVPTLNLSASSVVAGQELTANVANLVSFIVYTLDWGDGSSDSLSGAVTAAPKHMYASNGTFTIKLSTTGIAPVIQSVTVVIPAPALSLNPNAGNVGQSITANLTQLLAVVNYTLDWGDGSSDPITGVTTANPTHVYAAQGTFVVKVLATGIAPVTQPITIGIGIPSLVLSASSLTLGQITQATVSQMISSVTYTLDWGDGSSDPITGVTTLVVPHTYTAAGTFTVKLSATGIAPLILPVTISIPTPTVLIESNALTLGANAKITLGNLLAAVDYTFDWGDGSSDPISGQTSFVLTHQYTKAGVFAVKLSAKGIAPVVDTITVSIPVATISVSPNPVNLGEPVLAKLLGLATGVDYTLDWGDSTNDTLTGVSSTSLKHVYTATGTYLLKLTYTGGVPVLDTVKVEIPVPTLVLGQTDVQPGQSLTATLGNLLPLVTYSLEWGDASPVETFDGVSSAAPKHTYAVAGNYIVKLSYPNNAPVIQALVVSVPVPALDLNPSPALPNQVVTANLSSLLAAVDYLLEWGDGEVISINAKTSASLKHSYAALGQYTVKLSYLGGADIVKPFTVSLGALNESLSFTGNQSANAEITFNLSGLLKSPDYEYSLVFGESNEFAAVNVKADGTASLKHTYLNAGVKVVQLRINGVGANNLLRGTITLNLGAALQVSSLKLAFQPQASVNINLKQLTKQSAALSVVYSGSGLLEGNWFLDNQLLKSASLNLVANKTQAVLNIDTPTTVEGVHVLYFKSIPDPSSPNAVAVISNTITYTVTPAKLPTSLEIGGFSLEITSISNPVLTELAGTATLDLIIGGAMAAENLAIDFKDLKVTMNGTIAKVMTGQLEKKFSPVLELNSPLALAPQKIRLAKVLITTSGAKLDGNLPLLHPGCLTLLNAVSNFNSPALEKLSQSPPNPKAPPYTPTNAANQNASNLAQATLATGDRFEFSNQTLLPNGDLYATGTTISSDFKIGCSGVNLVSNQAATLDLSASQSPSTLAGAYSADTTPPNLSATWQGLFFANAKLELAGLIKGVAFVPVAISNGGYNFHLKLIGSSPFASPKTPNGSLPNPNTIVENWNFLINNLELGVNQNEVVLGKATGQTKIAFLNETVKVNFNWQPNATWSIATKGTISHDFGKTRVDTGLGAFIEQNQSLMLKFPCASWAIGAIATSTDDLSGTTTDNTDFCTYLADSNIDPSGLLTGARGTNSQPLYNPVTPSNAKQTLEDSVQVDLAGLGISANGLTSLNNSYAWQPLQGGGDLKLLGFAFPVTKIAVLQEVDRYYLALQGELEMGRLNDNTPLPTRKSSVRYYVKNGKDETLVMDKAAYQADVNATTKFQLKANTQTWQIANLGTTTTLFAAKKPRSKNTSSLEYNKKVANLADFEFADGGTIDIEGMSATVKAAFGLKGGVDYFFVWANVESVAPLFSLGVMSFFEFHGGLAHHMKWATGQYRQSPTFDKNTVLQIQVGAVLGTPTDGSTIHLDGTVLVDISGSVEIYADGWIFKTIASGYKAKAKPVLRAYIGINKDRLLLQACVGKSSPPKGGITCNDLSDLSFYGVATANGWLELYIPFKSTHFHLYVGTYSNRVKANFFQIYQATGYIMFGYLEGDQKPPVNIGGIKSQAPDGFGLAAGGSIAYNFNKHDEGSAICDWEWHFGFHYKIAADFLVEVTPKFLIDASVSFSAGFETGAHVCGIGLNFEIDIDLYGHIHAPNPTEFDGTAKLYIDLPIIPTFTVKVSVSISF
jgi:PKD repeat protein